MAMSMSPDEIFSFSFVLRQHGKDLVDRWNRIEHQDLAMSLSVGLTQGH